MPEIINCPSGLSGRVHGTKVREERILADPVSALREGSSGQGNYHGNDTADHPMKARVVAVVCTPGMGRILFWRDTEVQVFPCSSVND